MTGQAASMAWLPWAAAFAGFFLGSFLNVVSRSLAGGPSPFRARSACPQCGRALRAFPDLVPLAGYIWLRGRCRWCRAAISPFYPLGELAAGAAAGLSLAVWGLGAQGLACAVFCLALLVIAQVDALEGIVPDIVVLPALALALGAAAMGLEPGIKAAAVGAAFIGGGLWAVAFIYRRFRGIDGLGLGDVKLGALLGAYLGPYGGCLAVSLAAALGLAFYGALAAAGKVAWNARLPFAPFMGLGGAVMALSGGKLAGLWAGGW